MSEQEVAGVLARHRYMPCVEHTPTINAWWAQCEGCDWKGPRRSHRHADENDHRTHVAAALAPLIAERERLAKAEALREAADVTERWSAEESADAPGFTGWLRDRAAALTDPQTADGPGGHGDAAGTEEGL